MARSSFGVIIAVGLSLAACGSSKKNVDTSTSPTSCDPGVMRCDGQQVRVCNAEGTAETTAQTCAAGLFCREDGDDAACDSVACLANTAICDGSVATTCKADGSGPKPGGVDCADTDQNCDKGRCEDIVCEKGEKVCRNGDVYECDDKGRPTSLLVDCQGSNVCDADTGACGPKVCEPGLPSCDKNVAGTCNDFGTAFLPGSVDCSKTDEKCLAGKCGTQVCVPVQTYCDDGYLYTCDATGMSATRGKDCEADGDYHCEQANGGYAYCAPNECEPGEKRCINNVVKTCSDNHSLSGAGEDCGSDSYCEEGECKPRGCTEGLPFCRDGDIWDCQYAPSAPILVYECGEDLTCRVDPFGFSVATCVTPDCAPGTTGCLLNQVGTCGSDGETLSAITTDCTATDSVCTADNECTKTVTDTVGLDETGDWIYASSFVGAMFEVRSARKLTEIQAWLAFPSSRQLRWVVYELSGASFVAKVDKLVTVDGTSGFVTSGVDSFSFELKAGKTYALGVAATTADVQSYYDTAPFTGNPSFGVLRGRIASSYSSTLVAGDSYNSETAPFMKVVTELP